MSESRLIELYECQSYSRTNKWQPFAEFGWCTKENQEPCVPAIEITLPNNEWIWATEWTVSKMANITDDEGWEYASRMSRFGAKGRVPKPAEAAFSTVRRRLWTRVMRREIGVRAGDVPKALSKIQAGLASIHGARVRIEEIMKQAPEAADSEQMQALVRSVKKNIADVVSSLDQISMYQQKAGAQQNTNTAAVKKLRNDLMKEEVQYVARANPQGFSQLLYLLFYEWACRPFFLSVPHSFCQIY
jgi:hypothetical protein